MRAGAHHRRRHQRGPEDPGRPGGVVPQGHQGICPSEREDQSRQGVRPRTGPAGPQEQAHILQRSGQRKPGAEGVRVVHRLDRRVSHGEPLLQPGLHRAPPPGACGPQPREAVPERHGAAHEHDGQGDDDSPHGRRHLRERGGHRREHREPDAYLLRPGHLLLRPQQGREAQDGGGLRNRAGDGDGGHRGEVRQEQEGNIHQQAEDHRLRIQGLPVHQALQRRHHDAGGGPGLRALSHLLRRLRGCDDQGPRRSFPTSLDAAYSRALRPSGTNSEYLPMSSTSSRRTRSSGRFADM